MKNMCIKQIHTDQPDSHISPDNLHSMTDWFSANPNGGNKMLNFDNQKLKKIVQPVGGVYA